MTRFPWLDDVPALIALLLVCALSGVGVVMAYNLLGAVA